MAFLYRTLRNLIFLIYLALLSILYLLATPFFLLGFMLLRRGRLDDAFRIYNWTYGNYLVKASWPYLRFKIIGRENIPRDTAMVIVLNHRSSFDIFFSSLVPVANQLVIVRDWVYNIKLVRWAMKRAHYMNIDHTSMESFRRVGGLYSKRGVSFQFYPEGHRSRDGKLQKFRTGAFFMASENNLPVLPVLMTGTENFGSYKFPYLNPAKITIRIMPPVYPHRFAGDLRAQKMRKYVETLYRDVLGE